MGVDTYIFPRDPTVHFFFWLIKWRNNFLGNNAERERGNTFPLGGWTHVKLLPNKLCNGERGIQPLPVKNPKDTNKIPQFPGKNRDTKAKSPLQSGGAIQCFKQGIVSLTLRDKTMQELFAQWTKKQKQSAWVNVRMQKKQLTSDDPDSNQGPCDDWNTYSHML